jgi:hypothetical protein
MTPAMVVTVLRGGVSGSMAPAGQPQPRWRRVGMVISIACAGGKDSVDDDVKTFRIIRNAIPPPP